MITDVEIAEYIVRNFETITGRELSEVISEGMFVQEVVMDTEPFIRETLKEQFGMSNHAIDDFMYFLDDYLLDSQS